MFFVWLCVLLLLFFFDVLFIRVAFIWLFVVCFVLCVRVMFHLCFHALCLLVLCLVCRVFKVSCCLWFPDDLLLFYLFTFHAFAFCELSVLLYDLMLFSLFVLMLFMFKVSVLCVGLSWLLSIIFDVFEMTKNNTWNYMHENKNKYT